jgi:hypothetical protein
MEGTMNTNNGLCECGCGQPAPIAKMTNTKRGYIKGQPYSFIKNHHTVLTNKVIPNPSGLCMCGCGQLAPIAAYTDTPRQWVKGESKKYIMGHHSKVKTTHPMYRPLEERFWEKVNKQGPMPHAEAVRVHPDIAEQCCWEWTASTIFGYGRFDRKQAHRVAWFITTGTWPTLDVLHKCDNKKCVRFNHLFEGTDQTNADDREAKGRSGARVGAGKTKRPMLSERDVLAIRNAPSVSITQLSREFKADRHTIWKVRSYRTYKEVSSTTILEGALQ